MTFSINSQTNKNNSVNNIKCVGTIVETKLKTIKEGDCVKIRAKIIIQIENTFVPFYIYCNNNFGRLYNQVLAIANNTKVFLVANLTEYGFCATYIRKTTGSEYLSITLQGHLIEDKIILHNKDDIPFEVSYFCDKTYEIEPNVKYNLSLTYKNDTVVVEDVVQNESFSYLMLTNVVESGIIITDDEYEKLLRELKIVRLQRQ